MKNGKKSVLIIRYGALGDSIIISPVIKYYSKMGYYVFFHTGERGVEVHKSNPYVDEFVPWNDEVPIEKLNEFWCHLKEQLDIDLVVNLTQSIEANICLVDKVPEDFVKTREELWDRCNKNFYEETLRIANIPQSNEYLRPELFFNKHEEKEAKSYLRWDKFNVVCCLKASTSQRLYPHMIRLLNELVSEYDAIVNVVTVGDKNCIDLEGLLDYRIQKLSGDISPMVSFALTKYSNLVIAPDTGTLHAAGCFSTPKIGLLTSTTIENITKHFENDYSIEADRDICSCSPCFKIISDIKKWCKIDEETGSPVCMARGIKPEIVHDQIEAVFSKWRKRKGV